MPLRRCGLLILALFTLACGPGGARVVADRVNLGAIADGKLSVSGGPGAVVGEGVTTVTLSVWRATATPGGYRVTHLGGHLAVGSTYAEVAPDGSFPTVSIGASDRPVATGDELVITPQAGTAQAGYPVTLVVR